MQTKWIWMGSASAALVLSSGAWSQSTVLVSAGIAGAPANGVSGDPRVSDDGRFVAFTSAATNVARDANLYHDAFVRDVALGVTERVSISSSEGQANGASYVDHLSGHARWVLFTSYASNLVGGDTNAAGDVFLRDRWNGTTERVSVSSSGAQGSDVSWDGDMAVDGYQVVFTSSAGDLVPGDTNGWSDIFVHHRGTGVTERINVDSAGNQANEQSFTASISDWGEWVVFASRATNLVPGDTNGAQDVFVRNRPLGTTQRVSVSSSGAQANVDCVEPTISGDGRFVCFWSSADNLVAGDTNNAPDVFVHEVETGVTQRVSVNHAGQQASGSTRGWISGDGSHVALRSTSLLDGGSANGKIQAYVKDLFTGGVQCVSVAPTGAIGNDHTGFQVALSSNARFVALESPATNLAPDDTNGLQDIFLRDRAGCSPPVTAYCTAKTNSVGCVPAIAAIGTPSASAGSGFRIDAAQVIEQTTGMLFYGVVGPAASAFQDGYMCMRQPIRRTPLQTSTSDGSPPCKGRFSFDFNSRIASGVDPQLVPGRQVCAQYWSRDAASASGTSLTNALTFVICQ